MKLLDAVSILVCLTLPGTSMASPQAAEGATGGTVNVATLAQAAESALEVEFGGRLQTDWSFPLEGEPFNGAYGSLESGVEVRRARLHATGLMYSRIDFKLEVDFAGGEVAAKDMYVGLRGLPVGTRFGHFKEPFSLEELTSSRYITFIERSLINVLAPSRNTGLQLTGDLAGGSGGWAAGVFRDTDGFESVPGSNYGLSGRVTWAPTLENGGERLLHVGVSAMHRWIDGDFRLGVRPADHLAPRLLSVSIPADAATSVQLEAAANFGPLGLQGEWVVSSVDPVDGSSRSLNGYYLQAGYFLTGEHRPYRDRQFQRLSPAADLDEGGGAWELAARYARLDLEELEPVDGELWNLTLGVNWYWYPHFRWMFDLERADRPGVDGDAYSSFHLRAAVDF